MNPSRSPSKPWQWSTHSDIATRGRSRLVWQRRTPSSLLSPYNARWTAELDVQPVGHSSRCTEQKKPRGGDCERENGAPPKCCEDGCIFAGFASSISDGLH